MPYEQEVEQVKVSQPQATFKEFCQRAIQPRARREMSHAKAGRSPKQPGTCGILIAAFSC